MLRILHICNNMRFCCLMVVELQERNTHTLNISFAFLLLYHLIYVSCYTKQFFRQLNRIFKRNARIQIVYNKTCNNSIHLYYHLRCFSFGFQALGNFFLFVLQDVPISFLCQVAAFQVLFHHR